MKFENLIFLLFNWHLMLVFDITATSRSEGLPKLDKWLKPKYNGPGDQIWKEDLSRTFPQNWQQDFPDYDYSFPRFQDLKKKLNATKDKLDKYYANIHKSKKYETVTNLTRPLSKLRGPSGLIASEYGAEVVSNAWLKMYELCVFCNEMFGKIARSRNKQLNSVHFAEAPGNFVLAINHYLRNHYPVSWRWMANSYRELYSGSSFYLTDHHGMIKKYPKQWFYGADGDGDITSSANIRSFVHQINTHIPHKEKIHLATSDVKYAPKQMNYSEEERINIPVHFGQILSVLKVLDKGGCMIIKELTFYEPMSISLLFLLSNCFEQLLIVKPETSRPFNSEVYLVGIGYKDNLSSAQLDNLYQVLTYIREMNDGKSVPALFRKQDIPTTFMKRLYHISSRLAHSQINALNTNIKTYEQYKTKDYDEIDYELNDVHRVEVNRWVKCSGVKLLGHSDRLTI